MDLGNRLKKIRVFRNMKQSDLGQKAGTSSQMIINYENGSRGLTVKKLQEFSQILDVPLYAFFLEDFDSYLLALAKGDTELIGVESMLRIPVISKVSAGSGAIVEDNVSFYINIPKDVWPTCDFATVVEGNSMSPKIEDGEIIFVHSQNTLENGQIGLFSYENEVFVKKYKYNIVDKEVELISINPDYEKIIIQDDENFKIIGRVLGSFNYSL